MVVDCPRPSSTSSTSHRVSTLPRHLGTSLNRMAQINLKRVLRSVGVDISRVRPDAGLEAVAALPEGERTQYGVFRHVVWTPWEAEDDFIAVWRRIMDRTTLTPDRCWTLWSLAQQCVQTGDVAECGVYRGGSARMLAELLKGGCLHLFDSFSGLAHPSLTDGTWAAGDFADTSVETVTEALGAYADRCVIHPGWIPGTFEDINATATFDLVHLDQDLEKPTLDSLQYFWPRLSPGGALIVDDYGFPSCLGVRHAVQAFGGPEDMRRMYVPTGQFVAIKLSNRSTV